MKDNFVEIKNDKLRFVFDKLGDGEVFDVAFNRTLRIPDDNKTYNLPPSLGLFPLEHVEDYAKNLPSKWSERGGVFFPVHQAEAMWMNFNSRSGRPFAVKIASGKVNAVSGEAWTNELQGKNHRTGTDPDYMVCPTQPWLDGFNVGKGVIRQFVAVPLESGYTVEQQVTGKAEHGGIQIIVYPMKNDEWEKIKPKRNFTLRSMKASSASLESYSAQSADMGLGAGGMMNQEIYEDKYGVDVWDMDNPLRIFIHLANSLEYKNITGKNPPPSPATPELYKGYSYPWFSYYSDEPVLKKSDILSKVDSIASMQGKNKEQILPDDGIGHHPNHQPIVLGKKTVKDKKW